MAGYQVGGSCYPSVDLGMAAYAASFVPTVVPIGTSCNGFAVPAPVSGGVSVSWVRVSGSCSVPATASYSVTLQPCALFSHADAAEMAWKVAGCWILVFAVAVILKRALQ